MGWRVATRALPESPEVAPLPPVITNHCAGLRNDQKSGTSAYPLQLTAEGGFHALHSEE